jgi:hypothetical protein
MVGEVNLKDPAQVATYVGPDRLHLAFQFALLYAPWEARDWRGAIRSVQAAFEAVGGLPTWVLSNHDWSRIASRAGGEAGARAAAVLVLTLRGVPFLYAGDEFGLVDAEVSAERLVDPGGRDGSRAPVPWTTGSDHGWAGDPWLPRRERAVLRDGHMHLPDLRDEVIAVDRWSDGGDRMRVLVNVSGGDVEVADDVGWRVLLTSDLDAGAIGHRFDGVLPARWAMILEADG